jgi:hypothetical protein
MRGRGSEPYRGPLAFRRSATALAAASERRRSAQAALRASGRTQALPAPPNALKQGTLHAGHNAGGVVARTARERIANPPAGTALAPLSGSPSRKRPSLSEIRCWLITEMGTCCQGKSDDSRRGQVRSPATRSKKEHSDACSHRPFRLERMSRSTCVHGVR